MRKPASVNGMNILEGLTMTTTTASDLYRDEDEPVVVEITGGKLLVTLRDGRVIGTPLEWYPKLMNASPEQLARYELSPGGVHWSELDEDLSIQGMMRGRKSR
jgi:hypothetical protein